MTDLITEIANVICDDSKQKEAKEPCYCGGKIERYDDIWKCIECSKTFYYWK